jgi:hypothetical protein
LGDEHFLGIDSGDGCTTWGVVINSMNSVLEMVRMEKIIKCIFYCNLENTEKRDRVQGGGGF